jgi:hypothetical protein
MKTSAVIDGSADHRSSIIRPFQYPNLSQYDAVSVLRIGMARFFTKADSATVVRRNKSPNDAV